MAEEKKRGFHALEQRIHQMEEEDAKQEKTASSERDGDTARAAQPTPRETSRREK